MELFDAYGIVGKRIIEISFLCWIKMDLHLLTKSALLHNAYFG